MPGNPIGGVDRERRAGWGGQRERDGRERAGERKEMEGKGWGERRRERKGEGGGKIMGAGGGERKIPSNLRSKVPGFQQFSVRCYTDRTHYEKMIQL